jgi:hypothetical protein
MGTGNSNVFMTLRILIKLDLVKGHHVASYLYSMDVQVGIFVADLQRLRHIDEGTYALLGAASFLGGSMRLTMSACVMLLELTNNLALLPLIMLVLLVAKVRFEYARVTCKMLACTLGRVNDLTLKC